MQSLETEGGSACWGHAQVSSFSFHSLQNTSLPYAPWKNNLPCCTVQLALVVLATAEVSGAKFLMLLSIACTWVEMAPCKSADAKMKTTGVQMLQSKLLQHKRHLATAFRAQNLFSLKDGDFLLSFKCSD